jgi:hypothetical protein
LSKKHLEGKQFRKYVYENSDWRLSEDSNLIFESAKIDIYFDMQNTIFAKNIKILVFKAVFRILYLNYVRNKHSQGAEGKGDAWTEKETCFGRTTGAG